MAHAERRLANDLVSAVAGNRIGVNELRAPIASAEAGAVPRLGIQILQGLRALAFVLDVNVSVAV